MLVRLKKSVNTIERAFKMAQAQYGDMKSWSGWDDPEQIMAEYIAPQIVGAKVYPKSTTYYSAMCLDEGKKYPRGYSSPHYIWLTTVTATSPFPPSGAVSVKLPDNTCIGLSYSSQANIFIDTNGSDKGPNMAGKDLFFFQLDKNYLIKPTGYTLSRADLVSEEQNRTCSRGASSSGHYCAALIMVDGWQIKEDYPW